MGIPREAVTKGSQFANTIVINCSSHQFTQRVRWNGEPIGSLQGLSGIVTDLDAYKVTQGNWDNAMFDRAIHRAQHGTSSWLSRYIGPGDIETGEGLWQLMAEQICDW